MIQLCHPIYRPRRKSRRSVQKGATASRSRRLLFEPLENRLLMTITVNTLIDENNGIGVGGISLRDAIDAAAPAEMINFAASLTSGGPASILLTNGELVINKSLTINGPGANLLTVDAQLASRVIEITAGAFTVDIGGLRLTNGRAASGQNGGGIRAQSTALVTIRDSVIVGNGAGSGITGPGGSGGGIWTSGPMQVTGSTISGNGSGSGGVEREWRLWFQRRERWWNSEFGNTRRSSTAQSVETWPALVAMVDFRKATTAPVRVSAVRARSR